MKTETLVGPIPEHQIKNLKHENSLEGKVTNNILVLPTMVNRELSSVARARRRHQQLQHALGFGRTSEQMSFDLHRINRFPDLGRTIVERVPLVSSESVECTYASTPVAPITRTATTKHTILQHTQEPVRPTRITGIVVAAGRKRSSRQLSIVARAIP